MTNHIFRINGDFLTELATLHYQSRYNPPRKAFDFYSASALVRHMHLKDLHGMPRRELFYSDEYGLTLVSEKDDWEAALASYISYIDTRLGDGDSDFVRTKKEYFQREISIMQTIPHLPHLQVVDVVIRIATICSLRLRLCLLHAYLGPEHYHLFFMIEPVDGSQYGLRRSRMLHSL